MLAQNIALPATLTYITIIEILLIFILLRILLRNISLRNLLTPILSFMFISSGFLIQILANNYEKILCFFEHWKNVLSSPPITVLATALGIFLGNTCLKLISNESLRRDSTIIFINSLEAHIRSLSTIAFYFEKDDIDAAKIQIYLTKVRENKIYEKALTKIGRFKDNETDILSKYESHLWTTLIDIERSLAGSNIPILYSRLKITATIIYAMFCSYALAKKHWAIQAHNQSQSFMTDFPKSTQWLIESSVIECPTFIRKGFVDVLIDVRDRYQALYKDSDPQQVHPSLYVVYLPIDNSELMIFGNSTNEIETKIKKYLKSDLHKTTEEIEQAMQQSQSVIISP
ncbi:MAG: hypothetical protein ACKPCM_08970 [Pseudanabaena sp.]